MKFDGHLFERAAETYGKTYDSMRKWIFDLKNHENRTSPEMFKRGNHSMCFAFKGKEFSDIQNIYFVADRKISAAKKTGVN